MLKVDGHYNVGVAFPGSVVEIDVATWEKALSVNLTGALIAGRAVAPQMIKQKSGSIINISSISGLRILAGLSYVSYPTSKAALNQLTKVMAVELGQHGIRCNTLVPGFINTPMVEQAVLKSLSQGNESMSLQQYLDKRSDRIPLKYWGSAWDIAHAAVFLASDESRYITGIELLVDGGATLLAG